MLSLYEILKASKTGIAPDVWTALAGMNWGGKDSGAEVKELTGIPPLSFTADGTPLLDYLISGNMSQTGTPTPQNPVQPSECGELEVSGVKAGQYKIPILSAGQTNNIYLGEVPITRKIKKLVLTGNESWTIRGGEPSNVFFYEVSDNNIINNQAIWSHYINQDSGNFSDLQDKHGIIRIGASMDKTYIGFRDSTFPQTFEGVAQLKSWLAAQYAAGTPVTIWYVLATEETGIVNEPLRKIGNYADTVSYEQAGVQIPTLHGNTVIDVDTTLKPSEMYIKYQE